MPSATVRSSTPTPSPTPIQTLWSNAKFTKKDVVLGISNQKVFVRLVQVRWMPESELRSSLKFQVADLVPMPVDEAVLDFVPLDEVETDEQRFVRGLLVAASQDMVLGAIRACQKAGLTSRAVDLTPFAVLRSAGTTDPLGLSGPEAVVDVGARVTNIVVHEGGVPKFVRILLLGGDDITGAIVERLGIPTAEAERLKRDPAALAAPASADARRVVDAALNEFVDEVRGSVDYYIATTRAVRSPGSCSAAAARSPTASPSASPPRCARRSSTAVRSPTSPWARRASQPSSCSSSSRWPPSRWVSRWERCDGVLRSQAGREAPPTPPRT